MLTTGKKKKIKAKQTNEERKDGGKEKLFSTGSQRLTWEHKSLFLDSSVLCWGAAVMLCPGVRSSGQRLSLPPAACNVILGGFI